jgi:hypothetical protein
MPPLRPRTRRLSVTVGVTLGVLGTLLGFLVLILLPYFGNVYMQIIILLGSFALLAYFSHCLAHFIAGKIVGLNFSHYVFGASPLTQNNYEMIRTLDRLLPRLGIRLTNESRQNATHRQRVILFSSGILTSTLLPLIPVMMGYLSTPSPLEFLPSLIWIAYVIFGAYFSPKFGDLSHIKAPP